MAVKSPPTHRANLSADGVICIKAGFTEAEMCLVDDAFQWMIDHPGPGAGKRYTHEPATFYGSTGYAPEEAAFKRIFEQTGILATVRGLLDASRVFYLGEQLFHKYGGHARRTPWHQDLSYLPFAGDSVIGVWISLDDLPKDNCLEFVRGSHRGVLYNGASYLDLDDDTHPLYPHTDMPRLPDIQRARDNYEIVSWPIDRGDLVVFHLGTLHGGGATTPDIERRSLTLRFFGTDAVWTDPLPEPNPEAFSEKRSRAVRESAARPAPTQAPVPGQPIYKSGQFAEL